MYYFSSARSSEDILAASQVHGDTDTPITSVFQNSVISTGSAKQTWRACLSSGRASFEFDQETIQPKELL